jgi:hypothetical protein
MADARTRVDLSAVLAVGDDADRMLRDRLGTRETSYSRNLASQSSSLEIDGLSVVGTNAPLYAAIVRCLRKPAALRQPSPLHDKIA